MITNQILYANGYIPFHQQHTQQSNNIHIYTNNHTKYSTLHMNKRTFVGNDVHEVLQFFVKDKSSNYGAQHYNTWHNVMKTFIALKNHFSLSSQTKKQPW